MKTGRNDPCPCGSGKKYKHCCLPLERRTHQREGAGAAIRQAARTARTWLADIVPLPAVLDDDPGARPAGAVIMGDGLVLHLEILRRPSAEPDELAEEIARQVALAAERLGSHPQRLMVRWPEVAAVLAERLAPEIRVEVDPLEELDEAAFELRAEMSGTEPRAAFVCYPTTSAAWGLGEGWCARLFEAAAAFFRAAPWRRLWDSQVLELTGPSGERWLGCVMGHGGEEYGLALYGTEEDVEWVFGDLTGTGVDELIGPVLAVTFSPGSEIPREMRKEVSRAGWEVASPEAYPQLMTINTPAGGITRRDGEDLVAFLRALPGFVEEHRWALDAGGAIPARELADTGVRAGLWRPGPRSFAPPPGRLRPGSAKGPAARPDAALLDRETISEGPDLFVAREVKMVGRFRRALEDEGLGTRTVRKHTDNAETFIDFLAFHAGVPLAAVHEYDLRFFLFDWYPRKVASSRSRAMGVPGSLRRFFRYLAEEEQIRLPWATEVLAEKEHFESRWESFPGGFWWDPEVAEWCSFSWRALDARVMTHDESLGDGAWGATMGLREARLEGELQRRWLLWRDELLEQGVTDPDELRERLVERQRAWESAPHPDLDGKTPIEAVDAERAASPAQRS